MLLMCLLKELVLSELVKLPFWRQQTLRNVRYDVSVGFFEVHFVLTVLVNSQLQISCLTTIVTVVQRIVMQCTCMHYYLRLYGKASVEIRSYMSSLICCCRGLFHQ